MTRAKIYLKRQEYKVILNKVRYLFFTRLETRGFLKKVEKLEEVADLNKSYYYFALHLQPEATTLPNGGIYAEQILAIRILSKLLPDNTYLYVKEQLIQEKTEIEKETELITNIIKTREDLKKANRNFEYAQEELVDYYIYQIKAMQAKLDYLIKLAKAKGITVDMIKEIGFRNWEEEAG